jgi:Ca2+-transporting ATPase
MDPAAVQKLGAAVDELAGQGLRVLAVAQAYWHEHTAATATTSTIAMTVTTDPTANINGLPETPEGFDFQYLGLVGLADPVRQEVPAAVAECQAAGIRVVMITGDYPTTARAIGVATGLAKGTNQLRLITGPELALLEDAALAEQVRTVDVFARILPEQKLRIVLALQGVGEVVAMTGDGVNDAPALKAADIGIAMGGRGTDVAREAAGIVLLDDNFGSIVGAVRLGRRIYGNLQKAMGFIVAVHIPIAGLAILPLATGLPLLLGPLHIAFLEMVIDPVCSLAFEVESGDADAMQRPPRARGSRLFSQHQVVRAALQGLLALVLLVALTLTLHHQGVNAGTLRTMAFVALVASISALILANRTATRGGGPRHASGNPVLTGILVAVGLALALSQLWPTATRLFHFERLGTGMVTLALSTGALLLLCTELTKPRRKTDRGS